MLTGREQLERWLTRSKLNQREMADLLGVHFTHVNQLLSGRRLPGLAVAIRIMRTTGIPVEAWAAIPADATAATPSDTSATPQIDK